MIFEMILWTTFCVGVSKHLIKLIDTEQL